MGYENVTTALVVISAFGLVKKGTENYIGKILSNIISELQKVNLLTYFGGLYLPSRNPGDLQLPYKLD